MFLQVMAKFGVTQVKNEVGRVGSLALRAGQVVHFGLLVRWASPQDHAAFWGAAQSSGVQLSGSLTPVAPGSAWRTEERFFLELVRGLYSVGVERVVWGAETRVAFVRDQGARTGIAFKVEELQCMARGSEPLELHM